MWMGPGSFQRGGGGRGEGGVWAQNEWQQAQTEKQDIPHNHEEEIFTMRVTEK